MSEVFNLKNNQVFVLAEAAGGVYNSAQIRTIVDIAERESAFVKITEDGRMGFMIDPEKIAEVEGLLQTQGLLLRHYQSSAVPIVRTCLGELCPHSEQTALDDCLDVSAKLSSHFASPQPFVSIGMNGCARACVGSATDDIHIVAESTGYKISIGGKSRELPQLGQFLAENVKKEDLPELVCGILDVFYAQYQDGERMCDVIERIGMSPFLELAEGTESSLLGNEDALQLLDGDLDTELDISLDGDLEAASLEDTAHADLAAMDPRSELDSAEDTADTLDSADAVELPSPQLDLDPIEDDFEYFDSDLESSELGDVVPDTEEPAFEEILPEEESTEVETDTTETELEHAASDLLAEENVDLEDGTTEDLERVTRAIRSELELAESTPMGESNMMDEDLPDFVADHEEEMDVDDPLPNVASLQDRVQFQNSDDDFEDELPESPASSHQTTYESGSDGHHESPTQGGRFKVKIVGNNLCLTLPSGIECRVPVSSIVDGSVYEMEFSDGVLVIEGQGDVLVLRYGPLCVSVPLQSEKIAA